MRTWRWQSLGVIVAAVVAAYFPAPVPGTDYLGLWVAALAALAVFVAGAGILRGRRRRTLVGVPFSVAALLIAGLGVYVTGGARSYEASLPFVMFFLVSATYPPRTSFMLGLLTAAILVGVDLRGDPAFGLHRLLFQVPAVLLVGQYASLLYLDLSREWRKTQRMAEIAAAGRDLAALDAGAAMSALVHHLQRMTRADEVAIFIRDGAGLTCAERWVGPAFAKATRQPPPIDALRVGQGLVGWAAAHRRSSLVPDTRVDPRIQAPLPLGREPLACAVVPLLAPQAGRADRAEAVEPGAAEAGVGGQAPSPPGSAEEEEVVGVIRVARLGVGSLDAEDVHSAEVLAAQAALAIANARLFEQVRHQSLVDATTGLFNARYLARRLEEELARARRRNRPLSVGFIDSDSLKQVNDRLGHQRGDDLVREIAAQIRASVRAEDVPVRYAGDEFIVIMPDTPVEAAHGVLERVRAAVAAASLAFGGIATTVSVGVAGYPEHAASAEDLIRLADHAMYAAKAAGKNRVVVWSGLGV